MTGSTPPQEAAAKAPERELLERAVHDLKNPLAVVRASLEWLEVELSDREEALDAVRDASIASDRLLAIIDDLEALARLGTDALTIGDRVLLLPLVAAVVLAAGPELAKRGVAVERLGDEPLEATGNGLLLARSLRAFVAAAGRGAPSGACVDVAVAKRSSVSGALAIEISVSLRGALDAGPPESSLVALENSGLGVYLASRVIAAHGGSLAIVPTSSVPRVIICLPG